MKRTSVTGWVMAWEKENAILKHCELDSLVLRANIKEGLFLQKDPQKEMKKVRVTVQVDVEFLK